jgi:hypothetical protein
VEVLAPARKQEEDDGRGGDFHTSESHKITVAEAVVKPNSLSMRQKLNIPLKFSSVSSFV